MVRREGIAVAGTVLVDKLCEISAYPSVGELTKIRNIVFAAGGLVPNDGVDLKKLSPALPVFAIGKIGDDAEGRFVSSYLWSHGVDTSYLKVSAGEKTGFTDVMSIIGGQRTFFTYAGANATFGKSDIPWDDLHVRMLHLGYFLLLDAIDSGEGLAILREAKARGISTSIDLVSENSDRYAAVLPCLEYVDNLIVNEFEAGKLCGIEPTRDNLELIADKLLEAGVGERVIIHTPELALCKTRDLLTVLPSYELPYGFIKGTTGAGDAFCSGALLAIYKGLPDRQVLECAQASAVASLRETDATSGMTSIDDVLELVSGMKRKN